MGVLGTGVAFVLMGRLVGRVGATRASIVGYLIPVVALLLGVLIRNDVVGPFAVAGVVLVIAIGGRTSRRAARSSRSDRPHRIRPEVGYRCLVRSIRR